MIRNYLAKQLISGRRNSELFWVNSFFESASLKSARFRQNSICFSQRFVFKEKLRVKTFQPKKTLIACGCRTCIADRYLDSFRKMPWFWQTARRTVSTWTSQIRSSEMQKSLQKSRKMTGFRLKPLVDWDSQFESSLNALQIRLFDKTVSLINRVSFFEKNYQGLLD